MAGKVVLTGSLIDSQGRARVSAAPSETTIIGPLDAFGRLRVSEVTTLLDVKHAADKQALIVDEKTNGTANSAHSTTNSSVTMTTAASGDYVIRQTKHRPPYLNAKSHQAFMTLDDVYMETNVTKRVGLFSSDTSGTYSTGFDGIFFESSTDYFFYVYKSGTVTAQISRSHWDDPMDGTGPSGVDLNFERSQILMVDYEWLGVGAIRFGFVVDGRHYLAHTYEHANKGNSTYMTSPNKPIRYEIRQSGVGSGTMEMICSTVGTEGSRNIIGKDQSTSTGANTANANAIGTYYALCGIRLKSAQPNCHVNGISISVMATTSSTPFVWELRINPTVAGVFTYADKTNSACQVATGDVAANPSTNTVTGGHVVKSGYVDRGDKDSGQFETALHLGIGIDGTQDTMVLCVSPLAVNADIAGAINWQEID
jgi:hypothetical protein